MESRVQIGLGEYLRSEREKRHITIEQVASATKINIKLLHALEGDNYDTLPAKPFVRGFVTSYTRYVGLDYREVLARFDLFLDEKSSAKFKRPADAPHIFVEREGQTDNSKTWLSIIMVGFIVVGALGFLIAKPSLRHHHGRAKDRVPITNDEIVTVVPPPTDLAPLVVKSAPIKSAVIKPAADPVVVPPAVVAPSSPVAPVSINKKALEKKTEVSPQLTKVGSDLQPKPVSTASPVISVTPPPLVPAKTPVKIPPIPNNEVKHRLIVRAIDDAWVKYQADDRPLQQFTLKKDKLIWVRARTSIRFMTARPNALEVSYDNKAFQTFGSVFGNAAKTIIIPKESEGQFKAEPFVSPNPAYLSTPTH